MKLLDRYIGNTVLRTTAIILLVFIAVELLILFLGELRSLGQGNYNISALLVVVLCKLPGEMYQLFPMACLLGSLMGLGLLSANRELVVMRAAGFSKWRILLGLTKTACVVLLIVSILGELLGPLGEYWAQRHKLHAINGTAVTFTLQGIWLHDGNTYVHIGTVLANGTLRDINLYHFGAQQRLIKTQQAAQATYSKDTWKLYDVRESVLLPDRISAKHYPEVPWSIHLNPQLLKLSQSRTTTMNLRELKRFIEYTSENHLSAANYLFVYWQRLLQPLTTLVMMLLAVPFVFGPLRSSSTGLRLFVGICLGFSFFLINRFVGPFSLVYQWPPLLAACFPTLLFAVLGSILLWRQRY